MPTSRTDLTSLQDASCRLMNLLRAMIYLRDPCLCAESGPLEAVLDASLAAGKDLDDLINDLCDAAIDEKVSA